MGKDISLKTSDGHRFSAYLCEAKGQPRGAIIVIQEIFGVNVWMKNIMILLLNG